MQTTPEPPSDLGRYRLLAPTASVRVSPLSLGTMNFGEAWSSFMGTCTQETAFEILDYYYDAGGNFIDTANNYQDEESEDWVGQWMMMRSIREEIVIATKFSASTGFHGYAGTPKKIKVNTVGNSVKSLYHSVEASLKKLRSTYIDILYVHWWDYTTSIPELMRALNHLVTERKVLYLGISDTPAWIVSQANEYARHHGLQTFSVYQGRWSAAERDFERDILPMARHEGMALAPWGALGGGRFKTEEQLAKGADGRKGPFAVPTDVDKAVTAVLDKLSKKFKQPLLSVAQAYVMHKSPYVFPIIGCRTVEHLKGNIDALKVRLTTEDIKEIEDAYTFDLGFPHNFIGGTSPEKIWLSTMAAKVDFVQPERAINIE